MSEVGERWKLRRKREVGDCFAQQNNEYK